MSPHNQTTQQTKMKLVEQHRDLDWWRSLVHHHCVHGEYLICRRVEGLICLRKVYLAQLALSAPGKWRFLQHRIVAAKRDHAGLEIDVFDAHEVDRPAHRHY